MMEKNTTELELRVIVRIKDSSKYKRLLREEYAKTEERNPSGGYSLPMAIEWVLNGNPGIWDVKWIKDYSVSGRSPMGYKPTKADPEKIAYWPGWNEGVRA